MMGKGLTQLMDKNVDMNNTQTLINSCIFSREEGIDFDECILS